jgi:hypothetical protein
VEVAVFPAPVTVPSSTMLAGISEAVRFAFVIVTPERLLIACELGPFSLLEPCSKQK